MTVEELITELQSFPLDMEVQIRASRSQLEIDSIHVDSIGKIVEIDIGDIDIGHEYDDEY
ncbi:hypothetical protein [Nostoc punctiforme]|uniref:Uncharacterized protein n=2 Tax=Nostoc punctiforme TaxID=272131 RepID=B2ITF9_NOSP7|nr:hypothetical protein [Nostoc punctiforme]ACC81190.1 hypothetical protein Npun_F2636 [Nostoc punctiforme PCC 73102]RCJ41054.1 hypothetical protein A6769_39015 [Nostoc punctiforme NIES-2108]